MDLLGSWLSGPLPYWPGASLPSQIVLLVETVAEVNADADAEAGTNIVRRI